MSLCGTPSNTSRDAALCHADMRKEFRRLHLPVQNLPGLKDSAVLVAHLDLHVSGAECLALVQVWSFSLLLFEFVFSVVTLSTTYPPLEEKEGLMKGVNLS